MRQDIFDIVVMALRLILLVVTVVLLPKIKAWIEANTSEKERENARFWTRLVVQLAEDIYREHGQGKFKKEYVIKWLGKNGIKISESQMDALIRDVVTEFNKNGWGNILTNPEK